MNRHERAPTSEQCPHRVVEGIPVRSTTKCLLFFAVNQLNTPATFQRINVKVGRNASYFVNEVCDSTRIRVAAYQKEPRVSVLSSTHDNRKTMHLLCTSIYP
jgi:hypothetical protein